MTILRRALPSLFKGESILSLAALLCAALLLAGQPALASSHGGGGGGGGGHAGGGGGHSSGGHASGGGGHATSSSSGSHGFYGRGTAHPVGSGRFFGPGRVPGGGFHGGGFHGGFHGGFFHDHDAFFGGPFLGFGLGFGLGLGFGWDYPWGWGPGYYGYWGYPSYWYGGPGYYSPGYSPGYYSDGEDGYNGNQGSYTTPQRQPAREAMGALNLDISPSDAQVFLNGEYVGRVRDFGGWSRGYLWLEKGTYDIVFYKDGYKTLARQVSIYPGLVITWDDKMEHGQAVRPEDLPSKSHERRDSRLQFENDRAERIDQEQAQQQRQHGGSYYRGAPPSSPPPPPTSESDDESGGWSDNWRDRVNHDRGAQPQRYVRPAPQPGPYAAVNPPGAAESADRYGKLHLRIEPDDASVYLDGRFVGTGADLTGADAGLVLAPGHHKLAVVRPGRKAEERDFDAALGKDVDLRVTLSPAP